MLGESETQGAEHENTVKLTPQINLCLQSSYSHWQSSQPMYNIVQGLHLQHWSPLGDIDTEIDMYWYRESTNNSSRTKPLND
jgi:hypothetical protein